jgi:hypothetical protein
MPTSRSESAQVIYKLNYGGTLKFCHNLCTLFFAHDRRITIAAGAFNGLMRSIFSCVASKPRGEKSSLPRCVEVDSIIFWKITT